MNSDQSRWIVMRGLLRLVEASNGKLDGRIRLHKLAYLLKMKGGNDFVTLPFSYQSYGPSSRELSAVLHEAICYGFVAETEEMTADNEPKYSYELTAAGRDLLQQFEQDQALLPKTLQQVVNIQVNALELAATIIFLENDYDSPNRELALKRAIKIKPSRQDYLMPAKQVLETLQL